MIFFPYGRLAIKYHGDKISLNEVQKVNARCTFVCRKSYLASHIQRMQKEK